MLKKLTNLLVGRFSLFSKNASLSKYIGLPKGLLLPVKELNMPPKIPLELASLVLAVGSRPCLSKCPPKGRAAA